MRMRTIPITCMTSIAAISHGPSPSETRRPRRLAARASALFSRSASGPVRGRSWCWCSRLAQGVVSGPASRRPSLMGLGTAITVATIAVIAVSAKDLARRLSAGRDGRRRTGDARHRVRRGGTGAAAGRRPARGLYRGGAGDVFFEPCPGRDAAPFRAASQKPGPYQNAGVRYGPGSAAHRSARATRCACVRGHDTSYNRQPAPYRRQKRISPH